MKKNLLVVYVLTALLFISLSVTQQTTYAASPPKGEFISFSYDENGVPNAMTILDNDRRIKHTLASDVLFYINGRVTNEKSIKKGMEVHFLKSKNEVYEVQGIEDILADISAINPYQLNGIVTKIDPNGLFVTVKTDNGQEQHYFMNRNTRFLKGNTIADLSMLYEGDRVKMKLNNATSSTIYELEIINAGVLVENVYKAKLKTTDAYRNTITVENAQPFENWMFGSTMNTQLSSVKFDNKTSIYAGNQLIRKEDLRYYENRELYFATIKLYGQEIIQKIVVLMDNERTFYDDLKSVNTTESLLNLNRLGYIGYHAGSILIRNGRLIEPTSLASAGSAFVITDGATRSSYAQVVNVTNDGFTAPNLAGYDLYFGELAFVDTDNYLLELSDAVRLNQNYWKSESDLVLAYSNGTSAHLNYNSQVISLVPNMDLWEYESLYGYFYVKNGHVQALHLLDPSQQKTSRVLTGTVTAVSSQSPAALNVKNVSQWLNGGWAEAPALENVNLSQALILKDGKAISAAQIKPNHRVVLLSTNDLEVQVVLVNE